MQLVLNYCDTAVRRRVGGMFFPCLDSSNNCVGEGRLPSDERIRSLLRDFFDGTGTYNTAEFAIFSVSTALILLQIWHSLDGFSHFSPFCFYISLPGLAPSVNFHASLPLAKEEEATPEATSSAWDPLYALPLGIALAVPAIQYEWYLVNEETQVREFEKHWDWIGGHHYSH